MFCNSESKMIEKIYTLKTFLKNISIFLRFVTFKMGQEHLFVHDCNKFDSMLIQNAFCINSQLYQLELTSYTQYVTLRDFYIISIIYFTSNI